MIPAKQKVLEVLKDVVYFPKGSNIVDAEMVKDNSDRPYHLRSCMRHTHHL